MPNIDHPAYPVDIPVEIRLGAGDHWEGHLPSAAGAGYQWQVVCRSNDSDAVRAVITMSPPPSADAVNPKTSQAAPKLVLDASMPGAAVFLIQLIRPWNAEKPLAVREVSVIVDK